MMDDAIQSGEGEIPGDLGSSSLTKIVVVTPTFYKSKDDIRYELALQLCQTAADLRLPLIVIDASPQPDILSTMTAKGRTKDGIEFVYVRKQTYQGRKGAALREGIQAAARRLSGEEDKKAVICFQEPEKIDMMSKWRSIVDYMNETEADICAPKRSLDLFQTTYPVEQWHSEQFGNLHLDTLAKAVGFPSIDWTMGPIALRVSMADHWLKFNGELWDAQLVPMVRAQRWYGAKVISVEVDFSLAKEMKEEEEGVPSWTEKRLLQLNFLFEHVGRALKAESESSDEPEEEKPEKSWLTSTVSNIVKRPSALLLRWNSLGQK